MPEMAAPKIAAPKMAAPEMVAPEMAAPDQLVSVRERRGRIFQSWRPSPSLRDPVLSTVLSLSATVCLQAAEPGCGDAKLILLWCCC